MSVAVIIAAAGRGARLGGDVPKQLRLVAGKSLLTRSVEAFAAVPEVAEIVVVAPPELVKDARSHVPASSVDRVRVIPGGPRRQDSVALGLRSLSPGPDVVLVHDAARAFVPRAVIERTVLAARAGGAAIAAVRASDTVKRARAGASGPVIAATLPRDEIFLAQTPQGFRRDVLDAAVALGESGVEATDEARLAELAGFDVAIVEGDPRNIKVTTRGDLDVALALSALDAATDRPRAERQVTGGPHPEERESSTTATPRVGLGYDSHRLVEGRPLVLGGEHIPYARGLAGHSDGDAVAHAVSDALLGAAALGDIGALFPDTDPAWKGADSLALLGDVVRAVRTAGYRVGNVDVTVIAERPKLAGHRAAIRANLARVLGVPVEAVSVKAKTNEQMDATGRGEGIAVHAVALVVRD
jgi:2-C-methyl-D-erythritol 4-phosphate cytidylyltransferase/2-C-methyl-D-erythritol 2,4-cyclodiphosphate synthase